MAKKVLNGIVRSVPAEHAAVVEVETIKAHPLYKKRIRRTKRYLTQNDISVKLGDQVLIRECRPYSGNKKFMVVEVKPSTKRGV